MSQTLTKQRYKCGRERAPEEGGGKQRNTSDQQTKASLSGKNHLYRGDYVVRELSAGRRIFMKSSESGCHAGLVFIITKWFSPPLDGM